MLLPKPLIAFFRVSSSKKEKLLNVSLFEDNNLNPNLLWHEENNNKKDIYEIELHDRVNKKFFLFFSLKLKNP